MPVIIDSLSTLKPRSPASVVIALSGAIAVLYFGQRFFVTLILAVIIAFILEPFVGLLMRLHLPRSFASFVVCVVALLILYLAGLGFYTQFASLSRNLQVYSDSLAELVDSVASRVEEMEKSTYRLLVPKRIQEREKQQEVQAQQAAPAPRTASRRRSAEPPAPILPPPVQEVRILQEPTSLVSYFYSHLSSVYEILLMASFVPFLVYFMLSWRDHIHRAFLLLFDGSARLVAGNSLQGIAAMVRGFVVGNFTLGLLLALLSSLLFWAFRLPYPLLIGPLSGFLSLIPYIGLPLAMVPPLFAALPIYRTMPPYLLLGSTVGVLHLLALNLLYPKLVGSRVHLNPLVVTIALMLWGVLWGAVGLVLAIPLTAAIKAVCDNVRSLQPYGRLLGD
ncbi:MAG: AI-2E family transporter [Acidobacteria bacterium]|nr:AI-2E family transporter [Acidobacteriota bacterium]